MATDSWINETLYAAWGQRFRVKRELARVQSDFQDIVGDGGEVRGMVGGSYGIVFLARSIFRRTYQGGRAIFRYDEYETNRGLMAPRAFASNGPAKKIGRAHV